MTLLSVSMIVRNEEKFLAGCLESVRRIADEIVILDTGSTDGTVQLAVQAGAAVYHAPWTGSFAEARNASLNLCAGRWILYLDADERLREGQENTVSRLLADPDATAYMVLVQSTLSTGSGKATQAMAYPRLFRHAPGIRFEGEVHEQIAPSIHRAGGKILSSTLRIDHLGYDQGFDVLKQKIQRNLAPLLACVERNGNDWHAHLHIARSLLLLNDYTAVVQHAEATLRAPGLPGPFRAVALNLLAEVMLRTGRWNEAAACSRRSLALVPHQVGGLWLLAGALVSGKNVGDAIPVLEQLAEIQGTDRTATASLPDDVVLPPQAVWSLLGRCYAGAGMNEKAVETLFQALCADPTGAESAGKFWETHEKLGQLSLAVRHCEALMQLMPADPRPILYLALTRKRQGDPSAALDLLDKVLARDPASAAALSWKALWSLERQDLETAESALKQASSRGLETVELQRCAFELALTRGRYQEAMLRLAPLAQHLPADQVRALQRKLSMLTAVTPVRSESPE